MNKDFDTINDSDTKEDVFIKFSKLFSLEEDNTRYSDKSAGDFFDYMIQIKSKKSMKNIELSCMMWMMFQNVFINTLIKNEIDSADNYTNGLLFFCEEGGSDEKCKYFAYILNHYYKGEMERLFEVLISEEKYEICAKLIKYQNVDKIPHSVFDYF